MYNLEAEVAELMKKSKEKMGTANIMIVGKTGVGKSTLVNSIFRGNPATTGQGRPVTKGIQRISQPEIPLVIYDTRGLEINESVKEQISKEITGFLVEKSKEVSPHEHINVVWYCLLAGSSRIEDLEIELMREIAQKAKVILVITQSYTQQHREFVDFIKGMHLPVVCVVPVLADEMRIDSNFAVPPYGHKELVEQTYAYLPEAQREAFANAQMASIERKVKKSRVAVLGYAASAFTVGLTPIPWSDAPILIANQTAMLVHVTTIMGIPNDLFFIKRITSALSQSSLMALLGKALVGNLLKLVPGKGTIVGGVVCGTTASVLTAALGYAYIEVMEQVLPLVYAGKTVDTEEVVELIKKATKTQMKNSKALLKEIKANVGRPKAGHSEIEII